MEQKYYSPKYFTDIQGQKFGRLTAIRFDEFRLVAQNKKAAWWRVKCDCGKEKSVRRNCLVSGRLRSCGCARGDFAREASGKTFGQLTGSTWNGIIQNAKIRNHSILISPLEASELFERQKGLCAISGVPLVLFCTTLNKTIRTASLDRIDSSKGYETGNVQWIHKTINKMKSDLPESDFFNWIEKIYLNKLDGRANLNDNKL